jgi:hypothetical protein
MKLLLILLVLGMVFAGVVMNSEKAYAQYPNVAELEPFTASANFMSLPGYLRWQVFLEQGTWISVQEANEAVQEQMSAK